MSFEQRRGQPRGEPGQMIGKTPAEAGYRMPAEWEPHERCWIAWTSEKAWQREWLEPAQKAIATLAKTISAFEPVTVAVRSSDVAAARMLLDPAVTVWEVEFDGGWSRDIGPTFVVDAHGQIAGIDWQFNSWGYKLETYADDAAFAERLLHSTGLPRFVAPIVLEGGSIHVDGAGSVMVTESCLLNRNRNPALSRREIEVNLKQSLNVEQVIWLGQGLMDDATDGHVDNLACFVSPGVVLALDCDDPADANYAALKDNIVRLSHARDAQGRSLEVVTVCQPAPIYNGTRRMCLSYVNFYLANGAVIVPEFGDRKDKEAADTLARLFPERTVLTIPSLDILKGGGGIHCMTQQQPLTFCFGN